MNHSFNVDLAKEIGIETASLLNSQNENWNSGFVKSSFQKTNQQNYLNNQSEIMGNHEPIIKEKII